MAGFVKGPNDGSGRTAREFLEAALAQVAPVNPHEKRTTLDEDQEYVALRYERLAIYGGNDQ